MSQLFRFSAAVERDPAIEGWMLEHSDQLGAIAQRWFEVIRGCGDDVRELLHDGHPTACGRCGIRLCERLQSSREHDDDAAAIIKLIQTAYADIKRRLEAD